MFPGNVLWFLDNSEFLRAHRLFSFGHVGIKMNLILKRPALNVVLNYKLFTLKL